MTGTILPKSHRIIGGFNRCMDCDCGKFQESLSVPNICVCGHSYISHRFYENYQPQF